MKGRLPKAIVGMLVGLCLGAPVLGFIIGLILPPIKKKHKTEETTSTKGK